MAGLRPLIAPTALLATLIFAILVAENKGENGETRQTMYITVRENTPVAMKCRFPVEDPNQISWQKDGSTPSLGSNVRIKYYEGLSTLIIEKADLGEHSGSCKCVFNDSLHEEKFELSVVKNDLGCTVAKSGKVLTSGTPLYVDEVLQIECFITANFSLAGYIELTLLVDEKPVATQRVSSDYHFLARPNFFGRLALPLTKELNGASVVAVVEVDQFIKRNLDLPHILLDFNFHSVYKG